MKNEIKTSIVYALLACAVLIQSGCEIIDPGLFTKNRYKLTYDFGDQFKVLPSSILDYEIITPDTELPGESKPNTFHLIQNKAELEDFKNNFFKVDLKLEEDYFETGILLIHPKATYAGPIRNLSVFVRNNQLIMKYNWKDGMADCYCYKLVVVYLSPIEIL